MLNSKDVIANSGIKFGTSGARGLVTDFTAEVCAAFTHAFITAMKANFEFDTVGIAIDRRPSSHDMAMQCTAALEQMGIKAIYYGVIPTPALAYTTMQANIPAIMVTGSHIPFDRNGLKFYRPDGEISKSDEQLILNTEKNFEPTPTTPELAINASAAELYIDRYRAIVDSNALEGMHIGIYEHSSAGRDLYADLFTSLGAKVTSLGRSDEFVPIDTEAVSESDQKQAKEWSKEHKLDAIFSTDGDGDRPLLADENGEWLRGDVLGLLCARILEIEALSVPINCNTAIETSNSFKKVRRTKIGSPYVIAEFDTLKQDYTRIAGFEANGGFVLATDLEINNSTLSALPTRDALLPAILLVAKSKNSSISHLLHTLPPRFTASDRIIDFPASKSSLLIKTIQDSPEATLNKLGFDETVTDVCTTDGTRLTLSDSHIIHLRPSGNAPELRCYAEADTQENADRTVQKLKSAIQSASFEH